MCNGEYLQAIGQLNVDDVVGEAENEHPADVLVCYARRS